MNDHQNSIIAISLRKINLEFNQIAGLVMPTKFIAFLPSDERRCLPEIQIELQVSLSATGLNFLNKRRGFVTVEGAS